MKMKESRMPKTSFIILLLLVCTSLSFADYNGRLVAAVYSDTVQAEVEDLVVTVTVQNTGSSTWDGSSGYPSWICELYWEEDGWSHSSEQYIYASVLSGDTSEINMILDKEYIPDSPGTYSCELYTWYPESSFPTYYYNMTDSPIIITCTVTPAPPKNTVSGYVRNTDGIGISGVVMTGFPEEPSTDSSGYYNTMVFQDWSGIVTPSKEGYTFDPSSRAYSNVILDQTGQDYTANSIQYTISGYIQNSSGDGISGVIVDGLPGNQITDLAGYYSEAVSHNWSGTVTPSKAGCEFDPSSRTYSAVTSEQTEQNYINTLQSTIGINGALGIALAENEQGQITFDVYNLFSEILDWTLTGEQNCSWIIDVSPNTGSSSGITDATTVTVDINAAGLAVGEYACQLTISDSNGDSRIIPITLSVYDRVDFEEFALLGSYWGMIGCDAGQPCAEVDWFIDGTIDTLDLMQLTKSWLSEEISMDSSAIEDGFETGDFSGLNWLLSGDLNWGIVSDVFYEGDYSAKSGVISHSQTSVVAVTVDTTGFNSISFAYKVSSEEYFDYLRFYIDGSEQAEWSGTVDWTVAEYTVTDGQHTFEWRYTKDGSVSSDSDCAWIDDVFIFTKQ